MISIGKENRSSQCLSYKEQRERELVSTRFIFVCVFSSQCPPLHQEDVPHARDTEHGGRGPAEAHRRRHHRPEQAALSAGHLPGEAAGHAGAGSRAAAADAGVQLPLPPPLHHQHELCRQRPHAGEHRLRLAAGQFLPSHAERCSVPFKMVSVRSEKPIIMDLVSQQFHRLLNMLPVSESAGYVLLQVGCTPFLPMLKDAQFRSI